jgi:iron complex outermembrane recepter protein
MPAHSLGRRLGGSSAAVALLFGTSGALADDAAPTEAITVTGTAPVVAKYQLPQTVESITAPEIDRTINIVDSEDALRYLPSLFLRKRNEGDTQAVLETRTWGVNSSARSLVYADDTLISALIANNNTIGAPRWGLVAPEEIQRIDVLYGPFAAAYPGNSMGGVVQITTRMPDRFETTFKQTEAYQDFGLYGTHKDFLSSQTAATIGDRQGRLSWWLSANYLHSDSQPLTIVTTTAPPAGTAGTYLALNKTGGIADVVGAGGLLTSDMENANLKLAYDLTPAVRLSYSLGYWGNDTDSHVQTYLTDKDGNATFGGVSSFAGNDYTLSEAHLANALSLKTDTRGMFDGEIVASNYTYLNDIQRTPNGVTATGTGFTTAGRIARLDGTGWTNVDAKGIWRPGGPDGASEVSAGVHYDLYELDNPTYNTATWAGGSETGRNLYSSGRGKTETKALWVQDAWKFVPGWKLTLGGRYENWNAFDGYNFSTTGAGVGKSVNQPGENATRFSPKASLAWEALSDFDITGSVGRAYRFPTVSELYQLVTTGSTLSTPNPDLTPEKVLTEELDFERALTDGKIRLSFFQEHVSDALISQTAYLTNTTTPYTYVVNVGEIRNRGIELAADKRNVLIDGLDVSGSVTYVDAVTLSDPNFASTAGTTATGKRVPYVPDWRSTVEVTYRPDDKLALTAAVRYSGKQYSTLDNTDSVSHVMGAFDSFVVADLHAHYQLTERLGLDAGIDNINDEKYFLYHPFPGRTFFGALKATF